MSDIAVGNFQTATDDMTAAPPPDVDVQVGALPDDETVERLEAVIETYLDWALNDENKPAERAERWRKYIRLEASERDKPWPDAPMIITPLIRQKVDGVRAHVQAAIDQQPMFVIKPLSKPATDVKEEMERLFDLHFQMTDSRMEVIKAVRDAVEVGTGHLKHVVYTAEDGSLAVGSKYVPFEDIFVYPSNTTRSDTTSYFERYRETKTAILKGAERGIYDQEKVSDWIDENDDEGLNELEELWEVWIWFEGSVWEARYSRDVGLLFARRSYWNDVVGRAPYDPLYIEPSQGSYWGDSIPQILEGLQEVSDAAFNTEVAAAQYKLAPPAFVRQGSPAYTYIRKHKGIKPGEIIPTNGDPRLDIFIPKETYNPFSMQLLQLAGQMTEEATFSDMLVPGQPTGGRKTATEVNVLVSVGSLKLTNYYRNILYGLRRHANTKWELIAEYTPVLRNVRVNTGQFYWEPNGKESTTERNLRLQKLQGLLNPAFMQMVQMAGQNPFVAAILKGIVAELDLPSVSQALEEVISAAAQAQQAQAQAAQGMVAGAPPGAIG